MVKHITWDDSFNIGHSMIDSQHKRLFELVQELYELTLLPQEVRDSGASAILQECAGYINYHFTCEEKLMRDTRYEDATSHISQHKAFNTYHICAKLPIRIMTKWNAGAVSLTGCSDYFLRFRKSRTALAIVSGCGGQPGI